MGMSASQARFLSLTARKNNVEFQGQQINQQRTALSNESANIYNQMMDLTVPTPPSTSDYLKTNYVLEDSSFGSSSDFVIKNTVKNGTGENRYTVKLGYSETTAVGFVNSTAKVNSVSRTKIIDEGNASHYKYTTNIAGSNVTYEATDALAYSIDSDGNAIQKTDKNKIYLIDDKTKSFNLSGYSEAIEVLTKDGSYKAGDNLYFYEGTDGKNYFLTEAGLKYITEDAYTGNPDGTDPVYYGEKERFAQLAYTTNQTKNYTVDVQATLESASNGRYSTISIDSNQEGIPSNLKGATFSISTTQTTDEDSYNDAFNDYEYQKALYEQKISDLNAKTKVIQQEDQQLELRLKQLDTERNALNTEMDSVKKVIQDNVDKTFKIFA